MNLSCPRYEIEIKEPVLSEVIDLRTSASLPVSSVFVVVARGWRLGVSSLVESVGTYARG